MNTTLQNTIATAATNAVLDTLDAQPWYRRYAGTITTAAGGIVTLGTWLTTTGLDLPPIAQAILGAVVLVATVVAARATKNGQTPRTSTTTLDAVVPAVIDAVQKQGGLDQLVRDHAEAAANEVIDSASARARDAIAGIPGAEQALDAVRSIPGIGGVVSEAERAFLGRKP